MTNTILPISLVHLSLNCYIFTHPMLQIVFIVPLILRTILPMKNSTSLHLSLNKLTFILSLWYIESANTLKHILLEISIICCSIWKAIITLSMFRSIEELAFVVSTIFPFLFSLAIRQVVEPFSDVGIMLGIINQCTLSFSHIVSDLTLIITAFAEDKPTVTMGKSMSKGSAIV